MALKIRKQIYDNVHGYIGLTEAELEIIDTPVFQRLRHVRQLGAANLVYPGATHTRFEHSLGTMFMMSQFLEHVRKDRQPITEDEDVIQKMRLVGMLHDIGHYPLSHTVEHAVVKKLGGKRHMEFGSEIIKRFLREKLSSYSIPEITGMIQGREGGELGMMISSAFDADKSDYLLRDAYQTGVGYGQIGFDRLIRLVSFDDGKVIFDKDDAAVESFLLGRYHMYRAVYHHKTVTAFNLMAERIFECLINEGAIAHPDDMLKSADESALFNYNDNMLFSAMQNYRMDGKSNFLKELITMFLFRKPITLAYSHAAPERKGTEWKGSDIAYDDKKTQAFAKKAGVGEWEWIFPIHMRPLAIIDDKTPIFIRGRDSVAQIAKSNSLILHMVGNEEMHDERIYTNKKYKAAVQKFMKAGS